MEQNQQGIIKPKWLEETENNSWNPELLISAISIVGIFSISNEVNEFCIYLVQRFGLNPLLVMLINMYLNVSVLVLKVAFIIHLFMRGAWVAIVGLNYVFPNGADKSRLSKFQKQDWYLKEISDPVANILRMERLCSSIFAIAFTALGIIIWISSILVLVLLVNALGLSEIQALLLIVVGVIVLPSLGSITMYYYKKSYPERDIPWLKKFLVGHWRVMKIFIFPDSTNVFSTNTSPYKSFIFFFIMFLLLGFFSRFSSGRYISFAKTLLPKGEFLGESYDNSEIPEVIPLIVNNYGDKKDDGALVQKASIPSFQVNSKALEVFVAEYSWDDKVKNEIFEDREKKELPLKITIDSIHI
jgi:hypothetical protein